MQGMKTYSEAVVLSSWFYNEETSNAVNSNLWPFYTRKKQELTNRNEQNDLVGDFAALGAFYVRTLVRLTSVLAQFDKTWVTLWGFFRFLSILYTRSRAVFFVWLSIDRQCVALGNWIADAERPCRVLELVEWSLSVFQPTCRSWGREVGCYVYVRVCETSDRFSRKLAWTICCWALPQYGRIMSCRLTFEIWRWGAEFVSRARQ